MRRQLLRKLSRLKLPGNPLDDLLEQLGGPDRVSEMTGRKGRLVRNGAGSLVYEKRTHGLRDGKDQQVAMDRVNLTERAAFLEGRKLVAIISEAASCGISL